MPEEEIRWHYRFRNFSRAISIGWKSCMSG